MATPVKDLREWLESFEELDLIAIDDGGLALVGLTLSGVPTRAYIEVGGVPATEDHEQ